MTDLPVVCKCKFIRYTAWKFFAIIFVLVRQISVFSNTKNLMAPKRGKVPHQSPVWRDRGQGLISCFWLKSGFIFTICLVKYVEKISFSSWLDANHIRNAPRQENPCWNNIILSFWHNHRHCNQLNQHISNLNFYRVLLLWYLTLCGNPQILFGFLWSLLIIFTNFPMKLGLIVRLQY